MWDLPGPGLKPVSPALAGGFLTTAPPGKPHTHFFYLLSEAAFMLPQQSGRVVTEIACFTKPEALSGPLQKKFA